MSARKRLVLISLSGVAILAVIASTLGREQTRGVTLHSGGKSYTLLVAMTPSEQQLGLGRRASLPANQGMLFTFGQPAIQCFWMKDMHFPLDMIWVSAQRYVEYVQANVSPYTYPNTFCPNVPAQYVIELNAGQAKQAGIRRGQYLSF